ncbi:MAG: hypothetical protein AB1894_29950 [Chloroflexota bacterium]
MLVRLLLASSVALSLAGCSPTSSAPYRNPDFDCPTSEVYEVFYYQIECGINYSHQLIQIEHGEILELAQIELWSESFPC